MKRIPEIDLTAPGVVQGNHAAWVPNSGWKIPFSWGGRLTKFSRRGEATYDPASLLDEMCILRALADQGMAPPVGDLLYFESVVSDYPGAWHCDPCGAYGYEIVDARSLPPGRFCVEAMRRLPVEGSPGAWADLTVPGRGNVVNGYLIDVRRSGFDLLRWTGSAPPALPDAREPPEELRARVHRECQFPRGERAQAYQDFWLRNELQRGQRRVVERAQALGFAPRPGESVLDIGCQAGGFLQYAWTCTQGQGRFVGVEIEPGYVDCARALARSCAMNLCIRSMDVERERAAFLAWVRAYFKDTGGAPTHLLCLSMEKHIDLFPLVDALGARRTYIETNAVAKDSGQGPEPSGPWKLWDEVRARGGVQRGSSRDRNLRRLYVIERTG